MVGYGCFSLDFGSAYPAVKTVVPEALCAGPCFHPKGKSWIFHEPSNTRFDQTPGGLTNSKMNGFSIFPPQPWRDNVTIFFCSANSPCDNAGGGETVKPSLRKILAESYTSAIAILVLLLFSLGALFQALAGPLSRVAVFVFTAIAIQGLPYFSPILTVADRLMLTASLTHLFNALTYFAAAWVLSRWVYGVGPLSCLSKCRTALPRRNHV